MYRAWFGAFNIKEGDKSDSATISVIMTVSLTFTYVYIGLLF